MNISLRNKRIGNVLMMLSIGCMITGCTPVTSDDENLILVEKETEALTYEMAAASISDVVKTQKTKCTYQQVNDESLSFSVSGKRVAKVYVEEGDSVVKGQLLAELDIGNAETLIRDLEFSIAWNELNLEYIDINENQEISSVWLKFIYQSGGTQQEEEAVKESVEAIQQRYRYSREDCEDAIALDKEQLQILQADLKNSRLYAGMSGTVSYLEDRLEGSTTVRDEEVIKVIDSSECLFEVEDVSLAESFKEGVEVEMNIAYGTGAGSYRLVPYNMAEWEDKLLFTIPGDTSDINIEVGSMGTMRFAVDSRTQVLTVPLKAVHLADGKSFVYVLGDNQMREVKWIETGLFGDENVEVLSGLTEGERVIIK